MSLQEGNLRRVGDSLVIGCTYPACPWSATIGAGAAGPWNRSATVAEAEEKLHAHLEAVHPEPAARFPLLEELGLATPLLTDEELEAIDLMGRVADLLGLIVAPGPTAEQDILELHHHVHAIQRTIGSQAAARAYPRRFRQLGSVIDPEGS